MPVLLILVLAAIAEVAVLVTVGDLVGVLPTLGLLVLATLVGAWLLRREGTRALRAFTEAVRTRRPPHRELADGVLIAAAGVLVVLPGFLSDVVAILLLLPPTRALVRRRLVRSASLATPLRFAPGGFGNDRVADGAPGDVRDGRIVAGEVVPDRPTPTPGQAIPQRPDDHRSW